MGTNDFIKKNYATALKIHSTTEKLGLSVDDARLFTYIHLKITKANDVDYFSKENDTDVKALKFLLDVENKSITDSDNNALKAFAKIPKAIKEKDLQLRNELGIEGRIFTELNRRLRMHTDPAFREEIMSLYTNKLLPAMKADDETQVA